MRLEEESFEQEPLCRPEVRDFVLAQLLIPRHNDFDVEGLARLESLLYHIEAVLNNL